MCFSKRDICFFVVWTTKETVVIKIPLYNKLSYARILIGSHLWSIGGQTYRWRHNSIFFLILYYIKQIDSKFPCVCSVIDHRGRQNGVRTSVTWATFLFLPHFDVLWDLLRNRRTATCNLFVKKTIYGKKISMFLKYFHLLIFSPR